MGDRCWRLKEKGLMDMDSSVVTEAGRGLSGGGRGYKWSKWLWKKYNKKSRYQYKEKGKTLRRDLG